MSKRNYFLLNLPFIIQTHILVKCIRPCILLCWWNFFLLRQPQTNISNIQSQYTILIFSSNTKVGNVSVIYYFSLAVFPYPKSRIAIFIGNYINALMLEEYFEDHLYVYKRINCLAIWFILFLHMTIRICHTMLFLVCRVPRQYLPREKTPKNISPQRHIFYLSFILKQFSYSYDGDSPHKIHAERRPCVFRKEPPHDFS